MWFDSPSFTSILINSIVRTAFNYKYILFVEFFLKYRLKKYKLRRIYKLMKLLLRYIKHYIKYGILGPLKAISINESNRSKLEQNSDKRRVFAMQTPTHGNLGDHAIAFAQQEFLLKNIKNCEYIEIPFKEVFAKAKMIKKIIGPNDLIVIIGGGNMGDMYLYEELTRRFIVSYFKNVKIISFPQSIDFSNSILGKIALMGSKRIYNGNSNLSIIARETKSYELMKKEFGKDKVFLSPDIVLYLNERSDQYRKGIVTCLRNDLEKNMDNNFKKDLLGALEDKYREITVTDTIVKRKIDKNQRKGELQKIWEQFRNAEVVLTDRLHGMIFCVITGTPCIVFKNSNHKIEYSYKNWLSRLNYIKFANNENVDNIINLIEELKKVNQGNQIKEGINNDKFSSIIQLISK